MSSSLLSAGSARPQAAEGRHIELSAGELREVIMSRAVVNAAQ